MKMKDVIKNVDYANWHIFRRLGAIDSQGHLQPEFVIGKMWREHGFPPEMTADFIYSRLFKNNPEIADECIKFYEKVFI